MADRQVDPYGGSSTCLLPDTKTCLISWHDGHFVVNSVDSRSVAQSEILVPILVVKIYSFLSITSGIMSRAPSAPARGQPVGPRVPKEEFMRALGLDQNRTEHEAHYRAMRVSRGMNPVVETGN